MSDIEVGKCEVCGKDNVQLFHTYIRFPHVECKCHDTHHILIRHCANCNATVPEETTLTISVDVLRTIDFLISNHEDEYKRSLTWNKMGHKYFTKCDEVPFRRGVANSCEAMYMSD